MFTYLIIGAIALLILSKREQTKVPITYPIEGSDGNFYRLIANKGQLLSLPIDGSERLYPVVIEQNLYERQGEIGSYYMSNISSNLGINPNAKPIFMKFRT